MLSDLIFQSPWILAALAALPVLWWLLRVMPPRPKTVAFSGFFFLKDLKTNLKAAAHTPWWLLLLRTLIVAFFIFAFAEPILHPSQDIPASKDGTALIIVDNSWAAASNWKARQDKMGDALQQIRRSGRNVIVLPTAPAAEDGRVHPEGPMAAADAAAYLRRLKPQPWGVDDVEALTEAKKILEAHKDTYTLFFSDGLAADKDLLSLAQKIITDDSINSPVILKKTPMEPGHAHFTLERLQATAQRDVYLEAYADDGSIVDELKVTFPAGNKAHNVIWDMMPEKRNKTARLALRGQMTAAATYLTSAQWRQHPVGVIANAAHKENRDFLSDVYYLRRALDTNGEIAIDQLDHLLEQQLSALILPDSTPLTLEEKVTLEDWVRQGGFLIRFAGPNLSAQTDDSLLPVTLRQGQRSTQGAMTWEKPVPLGAIPSQSPLFGLQVPKDVTVARQLLAEPSPESFEKTWLQLEDGTPLVTGSKMDKGTVVLVHTSAGPDWSNFSYSGLYVEALQRMVSLSNGISDYKAQTMAAPLLLLDGFGKAFPPDSKTIVTPLAPDAAFTPSPRTPPGIYGDSQQFKTHNLGDYLPQMKALDLPVGATVESYRKSGEVDLKPLAIKLALLLLCIETLVTLWLRGALALATLALVLISTPAVAAPAEKDLASSLYLAYFKANDAATNRVSESGLGYLGQVISTRTTAKIKGVVALNPETDTLSYYPFIYWPMTSGEQRPSVTAAKNIQNYLAQGGMILFDTRDSQFGDAMSASGIGTRKLRELTMNLQIAELMPIPKDHILTRSFYLLDHFPGRYDSGKVWVEKEPSLHHDGVTSVIIGANDWAAAWDRDGQAPDAGGEQQREMAYRFGVNLFMTALTGNYKADQVHVPYILERLGQ